MKTFCGKISKYKFKVQIKPTTVASYTSKTGYVYYMYLSVDVCKAKKLDFSKGSTKILNKKIKN